jgi:multidrug transporter EmrE-like cation transporter
MRTIVLCVLLTSLELAGAALAKRALDLDSMGWGAIGACSFVALFAVYTVGLDQDSLTAVTAWWIVVSSIAAVVMDRVFYGGRLGVQQVLGVAVLLAGVAILERKPS